VPDADAERFENWRGRTDIEDIAPFELAWLALLTLLVHVRVLFNP
jgi:hypothetical protein